MGLDTCILLIPQRTPTLDLRKSTEPCDFLLDEGNDSTTVSFCAELQGKLQLLLRETPGLNIGLNILQRLMDQEKWSKLETSLYMTFSQIATARRHKAPICRVKHDR
jgi:hypothetical protein